MFGLGDSEGGAVTEQTGYGSGLVGGILDSVIGPVMANVQKGWSSRAARHARAWAEAMSSTAYQRTVEDLKKAGLNPMLAYTRGPSGYQGVSAAEVPDLAGGEGGISRALSTARQAALVNAELRAAKARADASESEAAIRANDKKSSDLYWKARGEAEVEGLRSAAERNIAGAHESMQNRKIGLQVEKQRQADAAAAQVLEEMRGTTPGKALIILREVLNSAGAR